MTRWALFALLLTGLSRSAGAAVTAEQASRFAKLALKCVHQEYPNKPEHVMNDDHDVRSPKALHPAFYGCFDWHSSVHGHWLLVRLLKEHPALPEAPTIREALELNLAKANIEAEVAYLGQKERKTFERPYGWAWLLKLAEELHGFDDPQARVWETNLAPLAQALSRRYQDFFPKQTYPVRTGVHPNTGFGLAFALDYARAVGDKELAALVIERSLAYYSKDKNVPASWEPGGEDFFPPALMEADLMRRVLPAKEFTTWFGRFMPKIPDNLLHPATVSDRSDPKIVHLDGLNLSRAWTMRSVASALPKNDRRRVVLARAAQEHLDSALKNVASGDYAGEHWLASFAVYALGTPTP